MSLESGSKLGAYEIRSLLGVGGMGEVYRALDTRLGRIVALKILRSDLAADADRRRRFEREARAVSSLNHPHICALYDIGHEQGVDFLVLEHLDGVTLADQLQRGALPLDQALRHGIEIAGALESAHRRGVVHRDLKPGNIMLTGFGAKLLDFGLATLKPAGPADTQTLMSAAPTEAILPPLTGGAAVIGTLPYMSPEHIEGREADPRSDVFALGAVMYEMITGRRPFEGGTTAALMAEILKSEPVPVSRIRPDVPPALDRVVERCLAKNPEDRWQRAHDVALELAWVRKSASTAGLISPDASRPARPGWAPWIVAVAGLIALVLGVLLVRAPRPASTREVVRFSLEVPEGASRANEPYWSHPSVSPDGGRVAFIANAEGTRGLWVRQLDALAARRLPGTEGALAPFWSPDSRSIGFFARTRLKTIPVDGGAARSVCDVAGPAATGSWSHRGTIVFTVDEAPGQEGLYRVSASGGAPSKLQLREEGSGREIAGAIFPHFLPDDERFLFTGLDTKGSGTLYAASPDSPEARVLVRWGEQQWLASQAAYAPLGYLLGVLERTLVAHPFDAARARLEGKPIRIAEGVRHWGPAAGFSISRNDVLVYVPAGGAGSRLGWFDRSGRSLNVVGTPAEHASLRLSPDGQRLVVGIEDPQTSTEDIWVFRFPEGTPTRLTAGPNNSSQPVWSPDGREIVLSTSAGLPHLFRLTLGETEPRVLVPENGHVQWAEDWSPDGRTIIYTDRDPGTLQDLWIVNVEGDAQPVPLVQTRFNESDAQFSPDGRWIAYVSDESGRSEVYLQSYAGSREKRRVSISGGRTPRWRRDGRELFYLNPEAESGVMSVPLDPSTADLLEAPRELFRVSSLIRDFDVTADGQRFLVNHEVQSGKGPLAHVVVNWTAELRP